MLPAFGAVRGCYLVDAYHFTAKAQRRKAGCFQTHCDRFQKEIFLYPFVIVC